MALPINLDKRWNTRISQASTEADHEIHQRLIARGYTPAQIATWAMLDVTRIELGAMYVLRTIRARLTAPEVKILDSTLQKIETRLREEIPLNSSREPIDAAQHDDGHLPRAAALEDETVNEPVYTFAPSGRIRGF